MLGHAANFIAHVLKVQLGTSQKVLLIAISYEVTLNSGYSWEYTKTGLNSGLGINMICAAKVKGNLLEILQSKAFLSLEAGTKGTWRSGVAIAQL